MEGSTDDMTEEEIDAIIAEQMANLPEWWETDYKREKWIWGERHPRIILNIVRRSNDMRRVS